MDEDIGVERKDGMLSKDFRHPHDASVRQRHRNITVLRDRPANRLDLPFAPECALKRPILKQLAQSYPRRRKAGQQIHRLGE
jgi:hypothetical protein